MISQFGELGWRACMAVGRTTMGYRSHPKADDEESEVKALLRDVDGREHGYLE